MKTFKREWRYGIFLLPHEVAIPEDAEFWKKPPQQRLRIMRTARHMMKYCNDLKELAFSESREGGIYHVINNMKEVENAYLRVRKNIFLTKEERSKYKRIYELYLDWKAEVFGHPQTRRTIKKSLRNHIIKRDKSTCRYCGKVLHKRQIELDHIQPLSRGGDNTARNLVVSCSPCNQKKGAKTPEQAGMEIIGAAA